MMILLPKALKDYFEDPTMTKIITGFSIGVFESCLITPFERLKTLKMTTLQQNFKYIAHMSF